LKAVDSFVKKIDNLIPRFDKISKFANSGFGKFLFGGSDFKMGLVPGAGTQNSPIQNVNNSKQNGTVNNNITVNTQASDAGSVAREIQSMLDTSYQNVLVSGGGK